MYSYTAELEHLILDTLLPVYEKALRAKGVIDPLKSIDDRLLRQIKKKKVLPALFRAKEKRT